MGSASVFDNIVKISLTAALGLAMSGCGGSGGAGESVAEFALSGTIDIEANTRVDGDTSDRLSFGGVPLSDPQLLPSTFILAGYLSAASGPRDLADPFDNFAEDPVDQFRVPFVTGEAVSVATFVESSDTSMITLSLKDLAGNQVASVDVNAGQLQELALPSGNPSGDYIVELATGTVDQAPLRYVATKLPTALTSQTWEWPRYEFLPGKAIVSLVQSSTGPERPASQGVPTGELLSLRQSGVSTERRLGNNLWLVRMSEARHARAQNAGNVALETLAWIEELRREPGVVSATPDYIMTSQADEPLEEPLFPLQWHYNVINAPTAWQLAPDGGRTAVVAVLDTGLFFDTAANDWHPDLAGNVVDPLPSGSDFIDGDNLPADVANELASSVFHGTHVAGTIAASAANLEGGTGVAFNAGLLPVRVLGEGGTGSSSGLIDALLWISETDPPRASVVNLSLGGLPEIKELQSAITGLAAKGVVVVAAAGNQRTSTPTFPAAAENTFAVSAVDGAGNLASYSNFGPWVDIAAPGGDSRRDANLDGRPDEVVSASASFTDGRFRPDYTGLQGTSMASPHVAGVFALMKSIDPTLDYDDLRVFLEAGELTGPVDGGRSDALGYGLIDASKAVLTAINNPSVTVLSAEPSIVTLSSETNPVQTVMLEQSGSDSFTASLDSDPIVTPDWLEVSRGTDPLSLTLNLIEEKLEPGRSVRTTLAVNYTSDSARTLQLPVLAEVLNDQLARDAGQHFILLVNTQPNANDEFEAEAQVTVDAENGRYSFSFQLDDGMEPKRLSEVRPGRYFLVAGTDLDNDGLICQAGEACAEYPVSGLREEIEVEADTNLTNIQMTTGYSRPGISASTPDILPRPDFEGYKLIPSQDGSPANSLKAIPNP